MNYSVKVVEPKLNVEVNVVVPSLQIAAGIVTHNAIRGYEVSVKMDPQRPYSHRNSAYAQAYIDVELMGLTRPKFEAVA